VVTTTKLTDVHDEQSLIAFGNDFFDRSAKAKRLMEYSWLLNIAFIAGDQLVNVNRHTGKLNRANVEYDPDWVVRMVDNRILPIYRTIVAKLTKNKPMPSAQAQSGDENDIQAARAAVKLLGNHWNTLELDAKHPEMVSWLVATGNCFYKQFWNAKKGDKITDFSGMDAEAGLTEEGLPQNKGKQQQIEFNLGDTDLIVRSPFNIYPEPGKTKLRECRIIGDAEIMGVDEIAELYGKEIAPEKDTKLVRINQTLEGTINRGQMEERNLDNNATVKELRILPCSQFPSGIIFGWANDKMLYAVEECKKLMFTHFGLIEMPGQFWYRSIIDDVIPIQRRWNSLLSKIEMHNDYYCDPPTVIDPNVIDPDEWTTEPGLLLEAKTPGMDVRAAVHVLQVPSLQPEIFKEFEILDQQFELVPILNKVSYGKDTSNATSGKAINFLQEKDDDIVRPIIDQIESGYADVFKTDFELCQDNYDEDRGFAIVGEDNEVEWIEFSKADLDANIDVGVEPGSAMPRSKAAQQSMVMDMLNAGFFTDSRTGKPDFAKALKYMEFGSVDDIYEEAAMDSNQAKRENEHMKDGIQVMPEQWHNHENHIYEHNRLRKTADYESFPPEIKQLFEAHIQAHEQFMQPPAPQQPQQPQGPPQGQGPPTGNGSIPPELQPVFDALPPQIQQMVQQMPPDQAMQFLSQPPGQIAQQIQQVMGQQGQQQQNNQF